MAPASDDVRERAIAAWLADGQADLATARSIARHRDEGTAPFAAAFHAQQAVEKGLKALLLASSVEFGPKHDLALLVSFLPAGATSARVSMAGLTVYAVEQRYTAGASDPLGLADRPTWEDAEEAIVIAEVALDAIANDIETRPTT